jgi:hypothetical protein
MTTEFTISSLLETHQLDDSVQYGERASFEEGVSKKIINHSSKEIITQLGNILSHPREYVQEEIPGQFSSYLLERYENQGFEIQFRCFRTKQYIRRWLLSKVLTFGNFGENDRILSAIIFQGNSEQERLLNLIVSKTIRRKSFLLVETYELCRGLYPLYFPVLPNVKDPRTEPRFLFVVSPKRKKHITKSHRIRNPSAVGGKQRQGINPLPMFASGGTGPSNVDEIFLETYDFLNSKNTLPV